MTVTVTEISRSDMPCSKVSGTGKRRVKVYVRATTTAAGEGLNLSAYTALKDLSDIEGIEYATAGNVVTAATNITWSSASASFAYVGTYEVGFICNLQ